MAVQPKADAIGLMGGTFDPVHNGHLAIINSFLQSGYLKRLIVVLTPNPPHKKGRQLTEYSHRLNMLKLALNNIPDLSISEIEKNLPTPSYTVNTVAYLKEKNPGKAIYLCIGEDSLHEFKTWYQWQRILEMCSLLVARRPGSQNSKESIPKDLQEHSVFIDHEPVKISSSRIRKKIMAGSDVSSILPDDVYRYIQKHNLYTN